MDSEEEHKHFYSHIDISYKYHEQEISEYNLIKILLRLEKNQNYDYLQREKEKIKNSQENLENTMANDNKKNSPIDDSDNSTTDILLGFKKFNVKIYLMNGDTEALHKKKRFSNLFDFILLGFHSKNIIKDLHLIGKDDLKVLIESNSFMTSFKKEERKLYKEKLIEKMNEMNFIMEKEEYVTTKGILKFVKAKSESYKSLDKDKEKLNGILHF